MAIISGVEVAPAAEEAPPSVPLRAAQGTLIALFFAIGFLTCLNDIIVPHFKAIFALDYTRAMLVQMSFFTAYFVVSPPAGLLVAKLGYRRAIAVGLAIAGAGCVGFVPAATLRSYPVFLASLFVLASGFTVLQVAANPYVAVLGDKRTASSRLTLTQAFNSLGTTIAPLLGSALILGGGDADGARGLAAPYVGFALALFAMSAALYVFRLPDVAPAARVDGAGSIWSHRPLVFGVVAIFTYVGAEVAIGSFLVSFLREHDIAALDARSAARCVSFYWGGAMIGRFAGAALLRKLPPGRVLSACAGGAFALVGATILLAGNPAMVAILSVGLFNSIMFPTIFTLAIAGLGANTGRASGALCMAIVGGAIVPVVQGMVADRVGVHAGFIVPLACYAYIGWYGALGSRRKSHEA